MDEHGQIADSARQHRYASVRQVRSCLIVAGLALTAVVALVLAARLWSDWVWARHREDIRAQLVQVQPLVDALEAYRNDHAKYPPDLANLVPKYIAAIPDTPFDFENDGWRYSADPQEVRGSGEESSAYNKPHRAPETLYHLWLYVPSDYTPLYGLFQDALAYRSDGYYPLLGYGGALERIDGWGYYHE